VEVLPRLPLWVPPLRVEAEKLLNPKRNPFFAHARMQLFVAERDGEAVGRIAAILNELHNQIHGDQVGFFGFFESVPDEAVARMLLHAAAEWIAQYGRTRLRGPVNPSMNDECGLLWRASSTRRRF
jgi:uncharacterized membrane-anchored protein